MIPKDRRINISLPPEIKNDLAILAALKGMPMATLAGRVLTEYVQNHSRDINRFSEFVREYRADDEAE